MSNAFTAVIFLLVSLQGGVGDIEGLPEYSILWSSDGPESITQTNVFNCRERTYIIVFQKHDRNKLELTKLEIADQKVSGDVVEDVRDFMTHFQRIDTVNFSCGGLYEGPNPHNKYGRDFRGQINIAFSGRSAEEPDNAASSCYDRGGIYLEEALGSITLSSEQVIRVDEPELGICVFGVTSVEILRPGETGKDL